MCGEGIVWSEMGPVGECWVCLVLPRPFLSRFALIFSLCWFPKCCIEQLREAGGFGVFWCCNLVLSLPIYS